MRGISHVQGDVTDVSHVQGDSRGGGEEEGASAMFKPIRGTRAVSHFKVITRGVGGGGR